MFLVKLSDKYWAGKNSVKCSHIEYAVRFRSEQAAKCAITKCRNKVPWIHNPYPEAKAINELSVIEFL